MSKKNYNIYSIKVPKCTHLTSYEYILVHYCRVHNLLIMAGKVGSKQVLAKYKYSRKDFHSKKIEVKFFQFHTKYVCAQLPIYNKNQYSHFLYISSIVIILQYVKVSAQFISKKTPSSCLIQCQYLPDICKILSIAFHVLLCAREKHFLTLIPYEQQ